MSHPPQVHLGCRPEPIKEIDIDEKDYDDFEFMGRVLAENLEIEQHINLAIGILRYTKVDTKFQKFKEWFALLV